MEIRLLNPGKHKIQVIKLIRLFSGLGLKELKDLADKTPSSFYISKAEIDFEQIKKNFDAIGAKIEKVESVKDVEPIKKTEPVVNKGSNVPGEDLKEKIPVPKKTIKSKQIKHEKKKVYEKPKFTAANKTSTYTDNKFLNLDKKANDLFFVKSVKNSLTIAVIGAIAYSTSFVYYYIHPFFAFLAIAIVIAISIRSTTGKTSRDLGIIAGAFTLFSFIIYPFFNNIIFSFLYGETMYFQAPSILFRFFSIFYPSAFVPAIIAYLITSNGNMGEKLNSIFKIGNKTSKSKFNSKTYQKGKRNIRRKKRKLD